VKFLIINQFCAPDPAPTGQLLADLARALAARGHSVTVLCARAAYAAADAPADLPAGITVRRLWGLPFARSAAARLLSYDSFYLGALFRSLFGARPDVVVTLTTPPLLSLVGTLAKQFRGSRHFIWEMDVYPDIAVALGVFRPHSLLTRVSGGLADWSRRRADGIIALGECMRDRLLARGIPPERIHVAENWADGDLIRPQPRPAAGPLTILYSGNLGLAHDTGTLAAALAALGADARFRFVFAGGGPRRPWLEEFCAARNLANVAFLPYQPARRMSAHLGACDVGLVTQNPATLGCVVPSKTYPLMAAGRPVLFVGPRRATPALLVERFRCGWQIGPGDAVGLIALLELLAASPELVREAGARAREAFAAHYDRAPGVGRLCYILTAGPAARELARKT